MINRTEVVVYFGNDSDANEFVAQHVSKYTDEPWIAPKATGYVVREASYPQTPGEPMSITCREYSANPAPETEP